MRKSRILTYRYEPFGGILHLQRPASLVWVDKDYMRSLGYPDSPLWDVPTRLLSAPTEVHVSVTRQCSAGCAGCYVDSYRPGTRPDLDSRELGLEGMKRIVDVLARARVFHAALGGGESLELPWFFDLADYARQQGIVPNLTTNGFFVSEHNAERCRVFGQINVSIDGTGDDYREARGIDGFEAADRALTLLRKAGCNTGINVVVSRRNFDRLESIFRYARKRGVNQVELLRFKPAGRGKDLFAELDLTPRQAFLFYPLVTSLSRRHRVRLRVDCSFMPMVFAHQPDRKRVERFGACGCLGGEMLMSVGPDGAVAACSFAGPESWDLAGLPGWWPSESAFAPFRKWQDHAPEPCASCRYLEFCRGGCHVVAQAVLGDWASPDPGCPLAGR
jgi:radical SAM protein with 4Fe4S-binding SPASM domain